MSTAFFCSCSPKLYWLSRDARSVRPLTTDFGGSWLVGHDLRYCLSGPFGRCFDVAVGEVSVAQRHLHVGVAEQER